VRPGIAMLTALFPPSIGGIQSHTRDLAHKLARRGLEVHVITREVPGAPRSEVMGNVHVHRQGTGTASFIAGALLRLRALRSRFEVLHAHQLLSPTTIAILWRLFSDKRILLNPHASGDIGDVQTLRRQGALGGARLALARRSADAFIAISRPIRAELEGAGVAPSAILDVRNGVDVDRFQPVDSDGRARLRRELGLPEGPLVITSGRIAREKGVDVLVAAWPRVAARIPSARLCILGDGAERQALSRLLPEALWVGGVADVAPYLRAADAFALASRTEGMPVALLEAMACGLPCVATAVGGTVEVLEDGLTGRLVPSEDPVRLAEGLVEALSGPSWGAAARSHVVQGFSLDDVADRCMEIYLSLLTVGEPLGRRAVP
jgi:glycosyltransferase involved in cell wall biosynthesis